MTSMMKKTVEMGSLYAPSEWGSKFAYRDEEGKRYQMPMAGKTGTPQNWSDAWAVGYSPYYTAAIWFGFDKPGNSLGVNLTGSTLAGPVWANFMQEVHKGLPFKDFVKPSTGIVEVTVCAKSGLLKTPNCPSEVTLPFLEGTQPTRYCDQHDAGGIRREPVSIEGMRQDTLLMDNSILLGELKLPELRLPEWQTEQSLARQPVPAAATRSSAGRSTRTGVASRLPQSPNAQTPRQNAPANQPAPDFRGSDYEGTLPPPAAPSQAPDPSADILTAAGQDGTDPAQTEEAWDPEIPGTVPAQTAPSRNARGNPIFSDEEFMLELPDYNPLLE
jgi:penicillin-binding protein 1A